MARRDESRNLSFVEPEPRKEAHLLLHLAHGIELEVSRVRRVRPSEISVDSAHASRMPRGIAWAHADRGALEQLRELCGKPNPSATRAAERLLQHITIKHGHDGGRRTAAVTNQRA